MSASNNEIVSGFDDETDETISIQLSRGRTEGALCAHLMGRLDTANSAHFGRRMQKVLDAGLCNITLDCAALTSMSSAGVGAVAALLKKCKDASGELVLANINDTVKELLALLDFDQFFSIVTIPSDGAVEKMTTQGASSQGTATQNAATVPKSAAATVAAHTSPVVAVAIFPLVIKCPSCGKALKVPKAGRYRCSACKAIIAVTGTGEVKLG